MMDQSIIWQCYSAIGLTLVLVFIYGPHIAYFEVLFHVGVFQKIAW